MIRQLFRTWMAFIVGGMVGATVMWLMAPMSGEETRRILRENIADAQIKANTTIEDTQAKARQVTEIGRRVVEESKSSLERGAEDVKSVARGTSSGNM
jgi:gas vesicle protein